MFKHAAGARVLAMTSTVSETSIHNIKLSFQLQHFARTGTTWEAFDSASGFCLPDHSLLSPRSLTDLRSKMAAYQINSAWPGYTFSSDEVISIPHSAHWIRRSAGKTYEDQCKSTEKDIP